MELSISVPVLSESFSLVGQNEVMFESDVSSVLPGFCFALFLVCSRNTLAMNKFGIAGGRIKSTYSAAAVQEKDFGIGSAREETTLRMKELEEEE